jgi:uncharacterized protein (TIGR03437 family)
MAANPPVNFTYNAGAWCNGDCTATGIHINALAEDSAGNTYFTGFTNLAGLPTTPQVFQATLPQSTCVAPFFGWPCTHAFVVKLGPAGNVVWATYLGGNGVDSGTAIAVDADGNVFVAGSTGLGLSGSGPSDTFPVTPGAPFGPPSPSDLFAGFLTKLSADGSQLLYSTFLPGSMGGNPATVALAIDASGNAYAAYQTDPSVPIATTPGAFEPTSSNSPVVVMKLNPSGSALVYATYLGTADSPASIAVDSAGNVVIAGFTQAASFPVTPGAFDTTNPAGQQAGFVSKLNAGGTGLIYSTYFGISANAVALDANGDAYVLSRVNPQTFPASGSVPTGANATALAHLSGDGSSLVYSIFIPSATSLTVDSVGNAYVAGTNINAAQTVFVERIAPGGVLSGMETLGGSEIYPFSDSATNIAVAPNGSVAIAGAVFSNDFPGIAGPVPSGGFAYACSFFINATVMNAANYTAGVVAPGEIVAILGYGFDVTPTTRVYFDEFPAPLLYVSNRQINAQVPWEIAGQSSTRMAINVADGPMSLSTYGPFVVAVAPSAPGVFYVTNSDGSINSPDNPAGRGDFVSVYGTGGGLTSLAGITGGFWPATPLASLTLPVSITLGGEKATVIYEGSAPTLLSGFFQVNVRIPQDVAPSGSTAIVLTIGTGQTTVPVAIR